MYTEVRPDTKASATAGPAHKP
jgi:hypothetical protein